MARGCHVILGGEEERGCVNGMLDQSLEGAVEVGAPQALACLRETTSSSDGMQDVDSTNDQHDVDIEMLEFSSHDSVLHCLAWISCLTSDLHQVSTHASSASLTPMIWDVSIDASHRSPSPHQ